MDLFQIKLCDIQGRLFELSIKERYDSSDFIRLFMNSKLADELDSQYNRMQWAGEEYLIEEFSDEYSNIAKDGSFFSDDVMYWIGYIYRYWHFYTNESSKLIYKQANGKTMNTNYLMFHTMAPEIAIENLKEIYKEKHSNNRWK